MELLEHLDENRRVLETLLKAATATVPAKQFFSPRDEEFAPVDLPTTTASIPRKFPSLKSLCNELLEKFSASSESARERLVDAIKLRLPVLTVPKSIPEVNLKDLETSFANEQIAVSVYSQTGYCFTAEFLLVYKARASANTAYKDSLAVCKRAIVTVEPAIDDLSLEKMAIFILATALRQNRYSCSICSQTLKSPSSIFTLPTECIQRSSKTTQIKIFIGRGDDHALRFWVRECFATKPTMTGGSKQQIEEEHQACARVFALFYQSYALSTEAAKAFCSKFEKKKSVLGMPRPGAATVGVALDWQEAAAYLVFALPGGDTLEANLEDSNDSYNATVRLGHDIEESLKRSTQQLVETSLAELHSAVGNSPSTELVGWGRSDSSSLGLGLDVSSLDPRVVPLPYPVMLEKVVQVACSPRHTLLLTKLGSVYSCGDNTDGALGLGDMILRPTFTLLKWPLGQTTVIVKVAAGGGSVGCHSLALDVTGKVYSWGEPHATGLGTTKPVMTPTLLNTFPAALAKPEGGEEAEGEVDEVDYDEVSFRLPTNRTTACAALTCCDIACGGGFSVAVLKDSGRVCTWGQWSHGRLGLGQTPIVTATTGRFGARGRKKMARYQLRPRCIRGVRDVIAVACGEAHTLALVKSGLVLSWGQNSCGQLGVGLSPGGFLSNSMKPVIVNPFRGVIDDNQNSVAAKTVSCGSFHCLVVDSTGAVWSWGARGSSCLGQGDAPLKGPWGDRIGAIFAAVTTSAKTMCPYELRAWCQSWSTPRKIAGSEELEVTHIAAGDMQTSLLSRSGRVFLCGSGNSVPPFISAEQLQAFQEKKSDNRHENLDRDQFVEDRNMELLQLSEFVSSPKCPGTNWLSALHSRQTLLIAGSGCRLFCLLGEDAICGTLTDPLLKAASGSGGELDEAALNDADAVLDRKGMVDCLIISSGKVLCTHKALVSSRSPELAELINAESTDDMDSVAQIVLPQLQVDAAVALVYFLYHDTLPDFVATNPSILSALLKSGDNLRMPRLKTLCQELLENLRSLYQEDRGGADRSKENSAPAVSLGELVPFECPPCTLARDLSNLVGDSSFADVCFIADGRRLFAHRFILEARCEYFKAMFRSGRTKAALDKHKEMVDVVIPDTYIGFLRLLIFLYTDTLPDGSDGALIEDLLSADRYDIKDMKLLCESMLCPSRDNCMDLLRAADVTGSSRLRHSVLCFLRSNMTVLSEHDVESEFPGLLETVMEKRWQCTPPPPSHIYSQRMQQATAEKSQDSVGPFPYYAVVAVVVGGVLYQFVGGITVIGPLVPVINSALIIVAVLYFLGIFRIK